MLNYKRLNAGDTHLAGLTTFAIVPRLKIFYKVNAMETYHQLNLDPNSCTVTEWIEIHFLTTKLFSKSWYLRRFTNKNIEPSAF